ncbi:hypothetical protein [Streptomyces litmocidini]|uniref:Uncharacterized protein n=1 Tax=Streptomyces litmocidini TaxID=67318 RepID=A0ABW7UBF5_9ACTN
MLDVQSSLHGRDGGASTGLAVRSYALIGDGDRAHDALAEADRLMRRLNPAEHADTWFGHCEQKHHVRLSHAVTSLGETRRARESQDWALLLSAPTSSMTRTLLRIDSAACLHRDGDTEQACRIASAALKPSRPPTPPA